MMSGVASPPQNVDYRSNLFDLFDAIDENGNQQLEYAELVSLPAARPACSCRPSNTPTPVAPQESWWRRRGGNPAELSM